MKKLFWGTPGFENGLAALYTRAPFPPEAEKAAAEIIADVRANGDAALVKYAKKFDRTDLTPEQFRVTAEELAAAGLGEDLPIVVLKAPVCRPTWLVEMECVAVKAENNPFPALA